MIPWGDKGVREALALMVKGPPEEWINQTGLEALRGALAEDAGFEALHPRWPSGTPGGLGGEFLDMSPYLHSTGHLPHSADDAAVEHYSAGWPVNTMLRGLPTSGHKDRHGHELTQEAMDEEVAALDAALARGEPIGGGRLYRGLDLSQAHPSVAEAVRTNGTFTDPGFLSTSGSLGVAQGFAHNNAETVQPVVLAIHAPEGTRGIRIPGPMNEAEVLLPRGGNFNVTGSRQITWGGFTYTWVDVEWAPR